MSRIAPMVLLIALIHLPAVARAETYYVSSSGSDANSGTTPEAAWLTVAHVNAARLMPGDAVLFRRGDTFHETLVPTRSGAAALPIVYGAFGTGPRPLFSGFSTLAAWTRVSGNVWDQPLPGGGAYLSSLVLGGTLQPLGRSPRASDSNAGYRTITSHSGSTSITDSSLPASPNFRGAEVYLRAFHWLSYRVPVTSHTGGTLGFAALPDAPTDGFGFFIQNHPATLTTNGDWYYREGRIGIYFNVAPPAVQVPTLERLLSIDGQSYLDFSDLAFEGANAEAVLARSGGFIRMLRCEVSFSGTHAIRFRDVNNVTLDGNTIRHSLSEGIVIDSNRAPDNVTVTNNVISDTGMIAGMAQRGGLEARATAVHVRVTSGATIERNTITDAGYIGIDFYGNDVSVRENVIDGTCSVMDDCGAIYTWNGPMVTQSNRIVSSNVISNGVGAGEGTPEGFTQADGIYLDNNSNHVEVTGNSVSRTANNAFHGNSPQFVTLRDNNFFDNGGAWTMTRWVNDGSSTVGGQDITNMVVEGNVFVSRTESQKAFSYADLGLNFPSASTHLARLTGMGVIDRNYYYATNALPFGLYFRNNRSSAYQFPPPQSFSQWKRFSGTETASTLLPPYPTYTTRLVGPNRYPAGDFESGIGGVSSFSAPLNHDLAHDMTGRLTGSGSMRISFRAPPSSPDASAALTAPVGPIDNTRKYILRLSTVGTSEGGLLRVSLRQAGFGARLSPNQLRAFGTERTDHELVFAAPTTDAAAAWQIEVVQNSGTTYLDDIAFYEAEVTPTSPEDHLRYEVNSTSVTRVVPLAESYADARGRAVCGAVSLAPFSSITLFRSSVPCAPTDAGLADLDASVADASVAGADATGADATLAGADASALDVDASADAGTRSDVGDGLEGSCTCSVIGAPATSRAYFVLPWVGVTLMACLRRRTRARSLADTA